MSWFSFRSRPEPGWLAVSLQANELAYAHGHHRLAGAPAVDVCALRRYEGDFAAAGRLARDARLERYQCATLLEPGEYQMLLVEAPAVPVTELRNAIRWRVKDMLDYHLDDATIDVLDVPPEAGAASARGHAMYVVAARNEVIRERIGRFEAAHIPLSVIDIPETAQRNIANLVEPRDRGVALLHLGAKQGLMTVNFQQELYLARRFDLGTEQLLGASGEARIELFNRVVLELQRTFDHFERQYSFVPIAKLALAPEPEPSGLAEHLASNLDVPVETLRLRELLAFGAAAELDAGAEWRLFHVLGACLRQGEKAL